MTDAATIAWIFYSLRLASATAPAEFREISQVADGLTHAVPNHKELQGSLRWLTSVGLVTKDSQGYAPSAVGIELLDEIRANTASEVLRQLTGRIGTRLELSPNTSLERTRER